MLPHKHGAARPRRLHAAGAVCASLGRVLFLIFWKPPGELISGFFFYVFGVGAIIGGVLTITSRNPVYSALWFALVVIATAGLFLLAGASFLAAGTVIVYAGAIIVTFLFVIMLAQMEGKAPYDRASRSPGPAAFACFLLLWCLIYSISAIASNRVNSSQAADEQGARKAELIRARELAAIPDIRKSAAVLGVVERAIPSTVLIRNSRNQEKPNVGGLGEALYTTHLVAVGLSGVLLFVALIGAVAITNPKRASATESI
jgi:NADH-quinone oxidoreductase subunit J